ncbi:F-actin-capping protein subunit beta [Orbilia ellipsospora]|uniref:F-actin-capping protein subunit beta n=1 Tax=Orbilia ellipsospora TaxID=2528407 RepID=A0AAV9XFD8_9PEZI
MIFSSFILQSYSLRVALLLVLLVGIALHLRTLFSDLISEKPAYISNTIAAHPVEKLHLQNTRKFEILISSQSKTPEEAIKAYKTRYSRNPPLGFEDWVRFALSHNSSIIDNYDIIEERIAPFRSISPSDLKQRMKSWIEHADKAYGTISIRDGKFTQGGEWFRTTLDSIVDKLPDMDILLNHLDEPRIVGNENTNQVKLDDLAGKNSWPILTQSCKFSHQTKKNIWGTNAQGDRFVEDTQKELDICAHPEYQKKHGFLNAPSNLRATRVLVPFVSTLSLTTMFDIIAPGLDYVDVHYIGDTPDKTPYAEKKTQLYWRGSTTGSLFNEDSWNHNQRIRFVQKFAGHPMFNVGISAFIQCGSFCDKLKQLVGLTPAEHATAGFDYKYAMDLDGNGYSGRYYRLLESNCLVFKQTLFEQWHDDRLVPWVHYVPVSMGMDELESAVNYFSNDAKGKAYGENIANAGRDWATKVLRPIDMTIYTYRLLLEYGALFNKTVTRG